MPTTLGHHFDAWAENLLDDVPWLEVAWAHLDRSPLGSASGFGVALPLDRRMVSDLLGFERLEINTLAVQNDRGKSEYLAMSAAAATATDLGRLASDLVWYSSEAMGFIALPVEVTTGSSIMPQKCNPDVLELIRAGASRLRSRTAEIAAVYGALGAGYHRDLQLTKEPFLEGMTSLVDMTRALCPVLDGLVVDVERCRGAVLAATGATDAAYRRVARGEPFREAYAAAAGQASSAAAPLEEGSSAADASAEGPSAAGPESWRDRVHEGAPGSLDPERHRQAIEAARARLSERRRATALDLLG
jgi:argininosuccinate lyase